MDLQQAEKKQILELDNRERLSVNSVENVEHFSPSEVILKTGTGKLKVSGSDMRIEDLSKQNGGIVIKGKIDSMNFADIRERRVSVKDIFK